ncbi:YdeI/OmpD-associated family protein [Phytoactinopolyspora endophytica]|uniref:YdeI/OmpD-associated family protein n=1 Tax=Phytoactinopolyspora endophytica TaxID=1642495 RepID=UPI00101CC27F|nr:YdeI/OmpD-associated family protein [Phytoactinopolyspora endophytica]
MNTVVASSATVWREWLEQNGRSEKEVWLVIHHKDSGTSSLRYHEAIEHALCFGWIDGLHRKRDSTSSQLRFTPRNPRSTWSRPNRRRAAEMIEQGLMTEHGQALIDMAKANGTWQLLPDDEVSAIPDDLQTAFDRNEAAWTNFERFPPSSKRLILEWIVKAKKPETRRRRIDQTVSLAAVNIRANHPGTRSAAGGLIPSN